MDVELKQLNFLTAMKKERKIRIHTKMKLRIWIRISSESHQNETKSLSGPAQNIQRQIQFPHFA
jgi:hypothetical protein